MKGSAAAWLYLLRPKQWTKNLLVFAALLFSGGAHQESATEALIAFACMCMLSSAIYVANDLKDVSKDRQHPTKRNRPIASGSVPPAGAALLGFGLAAGSFGLAFAKLNTSSLYVMSAYLALQLAYNGGLKRVPVADVFAIATGFILRAMLGAVAIWAPISGWLLFCTGSLALMLGFAKRRNEFLLSGEDRGATRESLLGYSRGALDALVIATAASAAICYGIYSIESQTARAHPLLMLTTLFVVYGISRYLLLVFSLEEGGEPADILLKDPHMLGTVVLFVLAALLAMSDVKIPLIIQ